MVDRDVNPLEQRHLALSARFKAAWAFHQLLMGMHRLNSGIEFQNRSDTFQPLFGRLKDFSESLHGATTGLDPQSSAEIGVLEREVARLVEELTKEEQSISPSELRRFFDQVRALDDRILIEVVRFYLEIQRGIPWQADRLDKVDFLISRLAERIAGPDLKADRSRLDKVLQGLLTSAEGVAIPDQELEGLISSLQDLQSEVRWVKTFEELNESRRVDVYRALKHDMGPRIFHARILPLVVQVNNSFRRKIEELRGHEELRLIEDYHRLSQLQETAQPEAELQAELQVLQEQVGRFRERAKANNVRISELVALGDTLRDVTSRLAAADPAADAETGAPPPVRAWTPANGEVSSGLVPDLECLEPHWSVLLKALSGLSGEIAAEQATSDTSLATFRLEEREIVAFRRRAGSGTSESGADAFVLAAAALRRRIGQDVVEMRGLQSRHPGAMPDKLIRRSRQTATIADAYIKHFSHLIEAAVYQGEIGEAQDLQRLRARMLREYSGLVLMMPASRGGEKSGGVSGFTSESAASELLSVPEAGIDLPTESGKS